MKKNILISGLPNTNKHSIGFNLSEVYKCSLINGNMFAIYNNFPVTMNMRKKE